MFTLPPLTYSYNALEPFIDEETMRLHHDKHHQTYLDNFNKILVGQENLLKMSAEDILINLARVPGDIRQKVRNFGGGYINHNLFWEVMSPPPNREPAGETIIAINNVFGSLGKFEEIFTQTALSRFGSGWVWLVANPVTKSGQAGLEIVDTSNQDTPLSERKIPLLTLDVWEHAYYLKYQNRRADYISAWWNVVNWPAVENKFKQVHGQF